MKINKEIHCKTCENKCDIYKTLCKKEYLIDQLKPVHIILNKNDTICKQGKPITHSIYILKGTAKLYIEGLNNRNIILYVLTPNNYIGLLSFFEIPYYFYSVSALETCKVCMVDIHTVKKLYKENYTFLSHLNETFGKAMVTIMQKIVSLNQKNIRGRLAEALIYLSNLYKSSSFNLILTRKELGELCAISEENVVRLLSEFKKEKIIDVKKKSITILDEMLLKKISEVG